MQIYQGEHLGTILNLKIDTSEPCDEVFLDIKNMIVGFEDRFSRFIPWNYLDSINQNHWGTLDQDAFQMLIYALQVARQSDGLFDPTILPYLRKIGYDDQTKENTNQNVGYQHIYLRKNQLTLNNHVEIEFGGIGKGYLIDQIVYFLREKGYSRFLVDFGGDIWSEGSWQIWLENPYDTSEVIDVITLNNCALGASNGTKRRFENSHHIIDPRLGRSNNSDRASFVLATSAMIADVHATLFCIMNQEEREKYMRKYGEKMNARVIE